LNIVDTYVSVSSALTQVSNFPKANEFKRVIQSGFALVGHTW
jgi:hypothetical protein